MINSCVPFDVRDKYHMVPGAYFSFKGYETHKRHGKSMIKNSTLILLFLSTGSPEFDQIISVLLKTSMAVGGIVAIILDNTIPGTDEERGLMAWRQSVSDENGEQFQTASIKIYDLPFGLNRLSNYKFAKYLPFLPNSDDKNEINENVELKEKNAGGLGRVA